MIASGIYLLLLIVSPKQFLLFALYTFTIYFYCFLFWLWLILWRSRVFTPYEALTSILRLDMDICWFSPARRVPPYLHDLSLSIQCLLGQRLLRPPVRGIGGSAAPITSYLLLTDFLNLQRPSSSTLTTCAVLRQSPPCWALSMWVTKVEL